ncbi:conserved hypothetical protein [Methylobacterium nodulans ORS 2060]|uniref:Uncharacterized protein n=1 Tax=Methylobacterium nodulans (strain LMG 21967 / CNCM I-2342 / ORS 2060) TaxID=460265 RepID=B8IQR6_METNO|nr:conserved hypothetical protein [Methylobacterium nodulans ORS 2060]
MHPRERALLVILSQAGEWVPLAELRSRGLGDIAVLASNAVAQGWVEYRLGTLDLRITDQGRTALDRGY